MSKTKSNKKTRREVLVRAPKMKIPEKTKDKKQKNKKKHVSKPKKEHVLIVAQEIKFARLLAGNEKKTRDRALKTLKKWLLSCFQKGYEFKEDDFLRIWKGLFYAVWMSDKPLVQEELCDNIASILDLFPPEQYKYALLMTKVGFKTLATEWYGLDQHRIDKCLMLVRRYLRGSLRCVARSKWSEQACKGYSKMLSGSDGLFALKTPLYARNATSMLLHFIDCYLEEIAKVSSGDIPPSSLSTLLRPLCAYMCGGESPVLCTAARRLLTALVRQSEEHFVYQERTRAWEKMGCPEGGPEALVSDDDDDDDDQQNGDECDAEENGLDKPLDPRAGRVDVILPTLPVPAKELATMLNDMLRSTSSKAHKRAKICMQRFEKLSRKEYPLPIIVPPVDSDPTPRPKPSEAARSLVTLEKTLISNSDELALRGLSRKHRKRLLAKSRAGMSIVEDAAVLTSTLSNAAGVFQVEDTEPDSKKTKSKSSNNETISKKAKKRSLDKQPVDIAAKRQKIDKQNVKNKDKKSKKIAKKTNIDQKPSKVDIVTTKTTEKLQSKVSTPKPEPKPLKTQSHEKKPKKGKVFKPETTKKDQKNPMKVEDVEKKPQVLSKKVKNFQKQLSPKADKNTSIHTPKKVKFVLKNNSMQGTMDYYKSVRQSPSIPFDSSKKPSKTNLKVSTPSPINPFFKKKLKLRI